MRTITLEVWTEQDALMLEELAKILNENHQKRASENNNFIQKLLENPIPLKEFKPLTKEEIYE